MLSVNLGLYDFYIIGARVLVIPCFIDVLHDAYSQTIICCVCIIDYVSFPKRNMAVNLCKTG